MTKDFKPWKWHWKSPPPIILIITVLLMTWAMTQWHLALAKCFTETVLQMRKPRLTQASLSKLQKLVRGEDGISICLLSSTVHFAGREGCILQVWSSTLSTCIFSLAHFGHYPSLSATWTAEKTEESFFLNQNTVFLLTFSCQQYRERQKHKPFIIQVQH